MAEEAKTEAVDGSTPQAARKGRAAVAKATSALGMVAMKTTEGGAVHFKTSEVIAIASGTDKKVSEVYLAGGAKFSLAVGSAVLLRKLEG